MIYIAAKMPEYCAIAGFVLALVCSYFAGVPIEVGLLRATGTMAAFAGVGMVLGLALAGVLGRGRAQEPRVAPPK